MAPRHFFLAALAMLALAAAQPARAEDKTAKAKSQPADAPKAAPADKPASSFAIKSPADKAVVLDQALVTGTVDATVKEDIWVVVWPKLAPGKGWPQSPNAAEGAPAVRDTEKNAWSVPVAFGGPAQSYEIAVYTATKAASAQIGKALKQWAKADKYPGLTSAQLGKLTERSRITVSKR